MFKRGFILAGIIASGTLFAASSGKAIKGIYYGPEKADAYQKKMCKLDLFLPAKKYKNFPVLIFLHGGGLTSGRRGGPNVMKSGIALVAVEYRLNPKVKCPAYLEDCAEAIAWTFKNIKKYGGDPNKIFISGMSAGGYLCAMLGMDKSWLAKQGINVDKIAGLIPQSGHMITHFTVRKERGIPAKCGLADDFSPMYHIRKTPFPIFIQCGDNDYPSRQEENKLFASMMLRYAGQPSSRIFYREYPGTHGTFRGEKTTADLIQFILQTVGLTKKSKFFSRNYKPEGKPVVIGRAFKGKLYLSPTVPKQDVTIVADASAPVKLTGTSEAPQVIKYDPKKKITSQTVTSLPVSIIKSSGEYVLKHSKSSAPVLTMKDRSKMKAWLSDKQLHISVTAKDNHVVPAPLGHLWKSAAIEIFVDFTPLKYLDINRLPHKKLDFRQYIFAAVPSENGRKQITNANGKGFDSKATYDVVKRKGGYTLTANIPLDEVPPLKKDGAVVGLGVQRDYCKADGAVKIEFLGPRGLSHRTRLHYPLFKVEK